MYRSCSSFKVAKAFKKNWVGKLETILTDQGKQFVENTFRKSCEDNRSLYKTGSKVKFRRHSMVEITMKPISLEVRLKKKIDA